MGDGSDEEVEVTGEAEGVGDGCGGWVWVCEDG